MSLESDEFAENNKTNIRDFIEEYFKKENVFHETKKKDLINRLENKLKAYPTDDLNLIIESTWDDLFSNILPHLHVIEELSQEEYGKAEDIKKFFNNHSTEKFLSNFLKKLDEIIKQEKEDLSLQYEFNKEISEKNYYPQIITEKPITENNDFIDIKNFKELYKKLTEEVFCN